MMRVITEEYGETGRLFVARCIGVNIVLGDFVGTEDIPGFYDIPNATDAGPFNQSRGKFIGAALMTTRYNAPCIHPGKKLEARYPIKIDGLAQRFVTVAEGRRGFAAMVIKPGSYSVGRQVSFVPMPTPARPRG